MTATSPTYSALKRILWVQNEADDRALLATLLRGHEVVFARNAYEALKQLNVAPFDAFILEYWLQDWGGAQLCREIRKVDQHAPVVFYTQTASEEVRKRAARAGASAYLLKPVEESRLLGELQALLDARDMESVRARGRAERALHDELDRRVPEVLKRADAARTSAHAAVERVSKTRAYVTFQEAGGTLANFGRWWPGMFASAWADALIRTDEADRGHPAAPPMRCSEHVLDFVP